MINQIVRFNKYNTISFAKRDFCIFICIIFYLLNLLLFYVCVFESVSKNKFDIKAEFIYCFVVNKLRSINNKS